MCKHNESFTDIDCLYSCSHWSVNNEDPAKVIDRFVATLINCQKDNLVAGIPRTIHTYGSDEKEIFEVWGPPANPDSLFIFIHGGYWQEGGPISVSPMVASLVAAGTTVVSIGYRLASHNRPVASLVYDIAGVVEKVLALFPHTARIVMGGHSVGAQLAFKVQSIIRSPRITGLYLIAGVFDLSELPGTVIGEPIGLTLEDAGEGTCRGDEFARGDVEVVLIVGDKETPKLRTQSAHMYDSLRSKGVKAQWKELPNEDHYSIMERFRMGDSKQMQLLRQFCSVQAL